MSEFSIYLTERAEEELNNALRHISEKWSAREVFNFGNDIDEALKQIKQSPFTYPIYSRTVRKFILDKHKIIFYRIQKDQIQVLSIWGGKQNPKKIRL